MDLKAQCPDHSTKFKMRREIASRSAELGLRIIQGGRSELYVLSWLEERRLRHRRQRMSATNPDDDKT